MSSLRLTRTTYFLLVAVLIWIISPQWMHAQSTYYQTNLVSDGFVPATTTDTNLKNPWGMVQGPTPFWVSDQATGVSTLYDGLGGKKSLVVTVNAVTPPPPPNGPTGIVFNTGTGFPIPTTTTSKSLFIFSDLNGSIYGWNASAGTAAQIGVTVPGGVLTGLAINSTGADIYASNFIPSGGIVEFNSSWSPVSTSFIDPTLPAGYEPYNVQDINGTLFVAYEPINTTPGPTYGFPVPGLGNGIIAEFKDTDGSFIGNLITGGQLDDPWGIVMAPSGFGKFSNDLLVGNFGNGMINAYDPTHGTFLGTLDDASGNPIVNSGLWALVFGNGTNNTNKNTLYITAGLNNQQDGVMAAINPAPEPASMILFGTGLLGLWYACRKFRTV